MPRNRRILALLVLVVASLAPAAEAAAQSENAKLKAALAREMRSASGSSGAYVADAESGQALFGWRSGTRRTLASNTKIFTIGAALAGAGPGATLETQVLGVGAIDPVTGTFPGDLYLRGAGDPSFGTSAYNRSQYAGGASVETLVDDLYSAGLRHVRGAVVGDESIWDRLRGTSYSGYGGSAAIGGPLTALAFNHGRNSQGRFQTNPPVYAADRLAQALRDRGVEIDAGSRAGDTPQAAVELAGVLSSPMSRLAQITGIRSENWFAEMLVKGLSAQGTTKAGVAESRRWARSLGATASLVDGSGLSASNRAAPREIVDFLRGEFDRPEYDAFVDALPTAGVNGTLATRMRGGAAHRRCHAKTGTLNAGHTALSGYCLTLGGRTLAFSIVMNYGSIGGDRGRQDRMAQAIARYRG
ncbi:MAG TPA: D-alanyl-D-alanine carboxypeptidase [Thermoleophilaceae bacterium]|jgi:D-alanyl-D-alanine carboxypeptidase/D-alanyl-D-alanine-endopeptidase (penicillin-binding protein 4)